MPIPPTFQSFIEEDVQQYGSPDLLELTPPAPRDERCREKLANWLEWRASPYPADRHSEYLFKPEVDAAGGPKILISAVMPTPASMEEYISSISAKRRYDVRGKKALKQGYTTRPIDPREEAGSIWRVIHSSDERQGRPISPMFGDRRPDHDFPSYVPTGDPWFDDICCGVFASDGALAAYLLGKRVGEHVQYDEIMGHADHLQHDVMYLLHFAFLEMCTENEHPPQCLNYGSWYSGTDPFSVEGGLNRWKRKVKFKPAYLILASSSEGSRDQEPRCCQVSCDALPAISRDSNCTSASPASLSDSMGDTPATSSRTSGFLRRSLTALFGKSRPAR